MLALRRSKIFIILLVIKLMLAADVSLKYRKQTPEEELRDVEKILRGIRYLGFHHEDRTASQEEKSESNEGTDHEESEKDKTEKEIDEGTVDAIGTQSDSNERKIHEVNEVSGAEETKYDGSSEGEVDKATFHELEEQPDASMIRKSLDSGAEEESSPNSESSPNLKFSPDSESSPSSESGLKSNDTSKTQLVNEMPRFYGDIMEVTKKTFTIKLSHEKLPPSIPYYEFVVLRLNSDSEGYPRLPVVDARAWQTFTPYKKAPMPGHPYIAAKFARDDVPRMFTVGDSLHYGGWYNGGLEPGSFFVMFVVGSVKDGDSVNHVVSQYISTVKDPNVAEFFHTEAEPELPILPIGVGLISGILVITIMIVLFVKRKYGKHNYCALATEETDHFPKMRLNMKTDTALTVDKIEQEKVSAKQGDQNKRRKAVSSESDNSDRESRDLGRTSNFEDAEYSGVPLSEDEKESCAGLRDKVAEMYTKTKLMKQAKQESSTYKKTKDGNIEHEVFSRSGKEVKRKSGKEYKSELLNTENGGNGKENRGKGKENRGKIRNREKSSDEKTRVDLDVEMNDVNAGVRENQRDARASKDYSDALRRRMEAYRWLIQEKQKKRIPANVDIKLILAGKVALPDSVMQNKPDLIDLERLKRDTIAFEENEINKTGAELLLT